MKKKPNIIFILADDMGYGDVSANNENCAFETPNIDLMAANGIRFTDAHASSAVCTPSRYSVLTGRYNWRSSMKSSVLGGYSRPILTEGRKTIASMLKRGGYYTSAVGKWHLGMKFKTDDSFVDNEDFSPSMGVDYKGKIESSPIDFGFDYYYGISGSLDMPPYVYIENNHFTHEPNHETEGFGARFWRKGPTAPDFIHEEVLDHLTDRVLSIIDDKKDDTFFIYFALPSPHKPLLPRKEFLGKSGTNEYGDFVLHTDDVVGRVIKKLKENNIFDDTILIFASDNGCAPYIGIEELKAKGHNPSYHFRGYKADIYEGGHRIPLLLSYPALIKGECKSDALVCLTDFYRTFANLLDIELLDDEAEDSISLLPILEGNVNCGRSELIHQSLDGSLSIRKGKWKLELCPGSGGWSYPVHKTDDVKGLPKFQLYDLESDIGEKNNLVCKYPSVVEELKSLLISQIKNGRSTEGSVQKNEGIAVWPAVSWLREEE